MYSNNLVVAIKVNGKVLREFDDTVALPFGSEYIILIKNLSNSRASVNVTIDGQDAVGGNLIIRANSTVELKRFVKNGNLNVGNAFKFIEKTEKVEKYRGNNAEDGLVVIRYSFEKQNPYKITTTPYQTTPTWTHPQYPVYPYNGDVRYKSSSVSDGELYCATVTASAGELPRCAGNVGLSANSLVNSTNALYTATSASVQGVTAPGSIVEQQFREVDDFITQGVTFTMALKLVGQTSDNVKIKAPVTVKKLIRCPMCGENTKQTAKFCHECGSSVQIV